VIELLSIYKKHFPELFPLSPNWLFDGNMEVAQCLFGTEYCKQPTVTDFLVRCIQYTINNTEKIMGMFIDAVKRDGLPLEKIGYCVLSRISLLFPNHFSLVLDAIEEEINAIDIESWVEFFGHSAKMGRNGPIAYMLTKPEKMEFMMVSEFVFCIPMRRSVKINFKDLVSIYPGTFREALSNETIREKIKENNLALTNIFIELGLMRQATTSNR
jgi:hypothetical protein